MERVRGPIEISSGSPWPITLTIFGGILLVALLWWWLVRKRQKKSPPISPYESALNELDIAARLTEGDDDRFAVVSSLALRRYLEDACGLRFRVKTSEEFLRGLKDDALFDSDFQGQLSEVLAAFDQIKFGGAAIDLEKRQILTQSVRSLIELTEAKFSGKEGGQS
jgi:hypothetical protein